MLVNECDSLQRDQLGMCGSPSEVTGKIGYYELSPASQISVKIATVLARSSADITDTRTGGSTTIGAVREPRPSRLTVAIPRPTPIRALRSRFVVTRERDLLPPGVPERVDGQGSEPVTER